MLLVSGGSVTRGIPACAHLDVPFSPASLPAGAHVLLALFAFPLWGFESFLDASVGPVVRRRLSHSVACRFVLSGRSLLKL